MNFPFASYGVGSGPIKQSSPTFVNVGSETYVVFGDEDGLVHVVDASTCQELAGWPRAMVAPAGQHASIESSPAVAFLDGPSSPPSIIVGSGSTWTHTPVGEIEGFNWTGTRRFLMRVPRTATNDIGVFSSPAVGDVAGDGEDIVFGSWDYYLYVLDSHGHVLAKYYNAETIWSSPALYRLPGQHTDDIFIGNDKTSPGVCVGGYISNFRYEPLPHGPTPGELVPVWQHCQGAPPGGHKGQSPWSSPAVGTIAPGEPAVFEGTSWYEDPFGDGTDKLYGYDAITGAPLAGWPVTTDGPTFGSPAIGELTSTGGHDIVDTSFVCAPPIATDTEANCLGGFSSVDAFSAQGRELWSDKLLGPTDLGSPILVPLESHPSPSENDVLVGSGAGIYPIAGDTGSFLYGTSNSTPARVVNPGCQIFNTPAVGNVIGTGQYQGWFAFESCDGPAGDGLYAFKLPFQPAGPADWPMFHQNADHTGLAR